MKIFNYKIIYSITFCLLLIIALPAQADDSITIRLKVITLDQVLFDDNFTVKPCPDGENSNNLTANGWCAIEQLVASQNWMAGSTWYSTGLMLNSINQYDGSDNNYWLWYSGDEVGETALNQYILSADEEILLTYGISPLKISASQNRPSVNSTSTLSLVYFDAINWQWYSSSGGTLTINEQVVNYEGDSYDLWISTTTPYVITASKPGYIASQPLILTPRLPDLNIKLRIVTASSTLMDRNLLVQACEKFPGSNDFSLNGRCALEQSGLATSWTYWGSDAYLNSIESYSNNQNENNLYWLWFSDLVYGQTALNNHVLSANEELMLVYGFYPLKISLATTTPLANSTSTIIVEQFEFDSCWNPTWTLATSSILHINGEEKLNGDGTFDMLIATTSPYSLKASKAGYLDSSISYLFPYLNTSQPDSGQSASGQEQPAGVTMPSWENQTQLQPNIDLDKAVTFLYSHQSSDGSIGSSALYSDWSAIALAAADASQAKEKIKNYLINAPYLISSYPVTDAERRAMALMALGINPYNGTPINFISEITSAFDKTQIGDPALFNDDIFALLVLLKAGYTSEEDMIKTIIKFILSEQADNGSWQNIDLTAAAIQVLSLAQNDNRLTPDMINQINQSINKAASFLRNHLKTDGSIGDNIMSTAWAVGAITALGQAISDWQINGQNPLKYLASAQQNDGGFDSPTVDLNLRLWATAYIIPAALNKNWLNILRDFAKPESSASIQNFLDLPNDLQVLASTTLENNVSSETASSSLPTVEQPEVIKAATTPDVAFKIEKKNQTLNNHVLPEESAKKLTPQKAESKVVSVLGFEEKFVEEDNKGQIITKSPQDGPNSQPLSPGDGNTKETTPDRNVVIIIFYLSASMSFVFGVSLIIKLLKNN